MFEYMKKSLFRCADFSTGITFLSLSKEFRVCLQQVFPYIHTCVVYILVFTYIYILIHLQYSESLKFRCPNPDPRGQIKPGKLPIYNINKQIEVYIHDCLYAHAHTYIHIVSILVFVGDPLPHHLHGRVLHRHGASTGEVNEVKDTIPIPQRGGLQLSDRCIHGFSIPHNECAGLWRGLSIGWRLHSDAQGFVFHIHTHIHTYIHFWFMVSYIHTYIHTYITLIILLYK